MNKIIASIVGLALIVPAFAGAAGCGDFGVNCSTGNPENVVAYGGFTNSQLPHVAPGAKAADGSVCPEFFAQMKIYCVDISRTAYYLSLK